MSRYRTPIVALACALAALVVGLFLGGHPTTLPGGLRQLFVEDERTLRAEVIEEIEDSYIRDVPRSQLENAPTVRAMVKSLRDPFSHYLSPTEFTRLQASVEGQFEGIGVGVMPDPRGLAVLVVFPGSPAERAGIHKGDVIAAVERRSIAGQHVDLAVAKIKGRPGTSVRLTVLTPDTGRRRDVVVERARIDVPPVTGGPRTAGGVKLGVVRLVTFSGGAHVKLRAKIDSLVAQGAKGILLDLRGNRGGLLNEGVLVSSVFVEDGPIVFTDGRTQDKRTFDAQGEAIDERVPVVVLVDRGTASAAEIVAGALRDRGRATLVGTRTFGKGVFQQVKRLSNGGALSLTVGSYFLPRGENLARRGIAPTVPARDLPRTPRDEALPVALRALRAKVK